MNNVEAYKRIDQSKGAIVNKMFWIALQKDSSELKSFLEDLDDDALAECFPTIVFEGDIEESLMEFDKWGFIAEVHFPKCDGFSFDKNNQPTGWAVHQGICRVGYVYGDTPLQLIRAIEQKSEVIFKEYLKEFKSKKN